MEEKNYYYQIGDVVGQFKIIKRWYGSTETHKKELKRYDYECIDCTYRGTKSEYDLKREVKCPCCCPSPKIVVEYINSIVAKEETKWMIDYFQSGYDEAKLYTPSSKKKVIFQCPYCGTLESTPRTIKDLKVKHGIPCLCQSKGGSLPERFVKSLLDYLNIDYIKEMGRTTFAWCEDYRYDFYIPSLGLIVETHGRQHYEDCKSWTGVSLKEQQEIDKIKEMIAYKNGINSYIVLDCRVQSKELKNVILKSQLLEMLRVDANEVDFDKILENALSSNIIKTCEIFNSSVKSTQKIGDIIGVHKNTIVGYLKLGAEMGLCTYDVKKQRANSSKEVEVYKDDVLLGVCKSTVELSNISQDKYGIKFSTSGIRKCCNNVIASHKGYTFKYTSK